MYRRLAGVTGVPRFITRLDADAFIVTFLEGRDLAAFPPGSLPAETFDRLLGIAEELHRRGVLHLDLRQRRNILVTADLAPQVVDFGGALALNPGSVLLEKMRWIDLAGVLKYKARHCPQAVTPAERRLLRRAQLARAFWPFNLNRERLRRRRFKG